VQVEVLVYAQPGVEVRVEVQDVEQVQVAEEGQGVEQAEAVWERGREDLVEAQGGEEAVVGQEVQVKVDLEV
jgi:hypothetical protein